MNTERLSIHPLTVHDHAFILELVNTEGWIRFIGDRQVHSTEDAQRYIQKMLENPNVNYWVVRLKNETTAVGVITWIKRDYLDQPDLGFAFLPAFAGKGYALEASQTMLNTFSKNQDRVLATTLPENFASIRLLEKLGFRLEKEIQVENETLRLYAITPGNR